MTVHQEQTTLELGPEISAASRLLILLHGRGATAASMLPIAQALEMPGSRILIPQAAGNRWYPLTAFGPLEINEPDLPSALQVIDDLIIASQQQGFPLDRIFLGGFSQGACLAAEYAARSLTRLGGLFVFSGALIGPPEQVRIPDGNLDQMAVFIGGSEQDPWIAHDWMKAAADYFINANAKVDFQTYPGMGHTVSQDEIERVQKILTELESKYMEI